MNTEIYYLEMPLGQSPRPEGRSKAGACFRYRVR